MRKYSIVLFFICGVLYSCKSGKQTQVSRSGEPVEVTLELVQAISGVEKGLENLRFYFEEDLVLRLDTTSGNGVWSVTEDGSVKLLSKETVIFPSNIYGKFSKPEDLKKSVSREVDSTFSCKTTFDDKGTIDAKVGIPELAMGFNGSGKLRVVSGLLAHGVDAVKFQNAIYLLPEGYQNIRVLVYKHEEGKSLSARGVKTPREEKAAKKK